MSRIRKNMSLSQDLGVQEVASLNDSRRKYSRFEDIVLVGEIQNVPRRFRPPPTFPPAEVGSRTTSVFQICSSKADLHNFFCSISEVGILCSRISLADCHRSYCSPR